MDTKTLQLKNRIRKIREAVILDYKEFGIALLPLEIVMDTPLPYFAKMGTDGKKLFIAPHIIADQSDEKIATGLMHESSHCSSNICNDSCISPVAIFSSDWSAII